MTVLRYTLCCAAMIMMAGCVTQQQYTLQGQAGTTATAVGRNVVAVSQGPVKRHVVVAAGSTIRIASTFSVNPDCTFKTYNEIRVLTKPAHGTTMVRHTKDYPNFVASNPNAVCNSTKLPGTELTYTPDDDFTGVDFMTVDIITASGRELEARVSITVK